MALWEHEIEVIIDDFAKAAFRAQTAGFDGVQVHGGHGYLLTQFLSPSVNQRRDRWGGSLENRSRLTLEILKAIRGACRADFQVGLRLSPERFGLSLMEVRQFAAELCQSDLVDYLDLSLWDVRKEPEEHAFKGRSLMSYFTEMPRGDTRLGVAGKVASARDAADAIESGADYVILGKAGIFVHDFPRRAMRDQSFRAPPVPVQQSLLEAEGVGPNFVSYLRSFPGLVADSGAPSCRPH